MELSGEAKFVGFRSGGKNGKNWCSATFDALDNPLERVEYFVPDELVEKVKQLSPGVVHLVVRLYSSKDHSFGFRLVDFDVVKK